MPKAVDIYVLDKKIGSGQFGDVFKGFSKVDGTEVAIKTINRSKIKGTPYCYKGKFNELLDNEIKVLRSCKNNNIIRLIDIKKTANNIYLILEYCNEGDLGAYLKLKKKIPENEAVEYFVQILHAFETLVKNKIMHRDFKLPNVLKHEGAIKLADFGFAKLLGSEDQQVETILGSPLNMAPEVLDRQSYNSKADIWSIGVSFYEMITGKVPFMANNIIDLLNKIRKDPVVFPHKLPFVIEDVIRKMLIVDPVKRIDWNDLFKHPITTYLEDKLTDNLTQSIHCNKEDFRFNLSKFYIKTNTVIETPYEIKAKEELNAHIKQMIKDESPSQFTGQYIKRDTERKEKQSTAMLTLGTDKEIKEEENEGEGDSEIIEKKELSLNEICQENWRIILHERNVYAFIGHLAEEALEINYNIYGECLAFLMLKKAMTRIVCLKKALASRNLNGIRQWEVYEKTEEHKKVLSLINEEEEIFNQLYEKLSLKVLEKGTLTQFEEDLMISGQFTVEETQRKTYIRVMIEYFNRSLSKSCEDVEMYKHFSQVIDSLDIDGLFPLNFDFAAYYEAFHETEDTIAMQVCKKKYNEFVKNYGKYKP